MLSSNVRALAPQSLAVVAAVALLGGCDPEPLDEVDRLDDEQERFDDEDIVDPELSLAAEVEDDVDPIVDGANTVTDTDVDPQWPEVVRISSGGGCSGTLISPVHVLTAGHCVGAAGGTVSLDASIGAGSGTGRWTYDIVQWKVLSGAVASGSDLAIAVLDEAVPSFGPAGSPEYSVDPAPALSAVSNFVTTFTVGFGNNDDCAQTGFGTRRGLAYYGGFTTYGSVPGVVTRGNLPCDHVNKGPSPGDSGGPLLNLWGDVVGVFSGWSCRDASGTIGAAGCNGTIEWTGLSPANAAWIDASLQGDFDGDGIADIDDPLPGTDCGGAAPPAECAGLLPDFRVEQISAAGCTGSGGDPVVAVTVENDGPIADAAWVDLFHGLAAAPSPGEYSTIYRRSNVLAHRETQTLYFSVDVPPGGRWVDVIVDTTLSVTELNEGNNVGSAYLNLPDCSFN